MASVSSDDFFDPQIYAVRGVPYEAFERRRRAEGPVVWCEEPAVLGWPGGPGFWAVLGHAELGEVLRDHERFSSGLGATQIRDPATPDALAFARSTMLNTDPPEHTRLRRLLSKSFTPRAVRAVEDTIHRRARTLVDAVLDRGEADFARDVGADMPLLTLAEIMGVPSQDRWLLFDWSNRVIGYQDPEYSVSDSFDQSAVTPMAVAARRERRHIVRGSDGLLPDPRTRAGLADMYAYAHELARYKRANPGDDILSILLRSQDEDGAITDLEFEMMFFLFAVAGNETLRNGIPGGMHSLLTHPDQYTRLCADMELLPSAVEEMLRFCPPVIHFRRTATRNTELGGREIAAGDKVVVYFAAANRDPAVFEEPDRFDIGRSPNDHTTFGAGVHFCLGAHFARLQLQAIYREVLTRMTNLELAGPVEYLQSNFQNGIKHLPVRWST